MNTITKRMINGMLACFMIISLLSRNMVFASAATDAAKTTGTNAAVYEYSPMLEKGGNIYYIQRVEGREYSYDIYRLEVDTGNITRLISSKSDILGMMFHKDTLYYTYYDENDVYRTKSYSINTKEVKTICNGYFITLDDNSIYYTVSKGKETKLYKKNYNSKKAVLIYTGNMTLQFVKNLDNNLYFSQYNEGNSKLTLYTLMPGNTKLTAVTSDKIKLEDTRPSYPFVSDIVRLNKDIYYQYGRLEGSGNYWYGTLIKLASPGKVKSVIAEQMYEEQIHHNGSSIFYIGNESSGKQYQYNTKTNKTSTYTYKTSGTETFNMIGAETYSAGADGKEWITVYRSTSGTIRSKTDKPFIRLSYRQEEEYDYYASVRRYGDYLLIPVTCMDYRDNSNGWRGRIVGVSWYVYGSDGKLLAQFQ